MVTISYGHFFSHFLKNLSILFPQNDEMAMTMTLHFLFKTLKRSFFWSPLFPWNVKWLKFRYFTQKTFLKVGSESYRHLFDENIEHELRKRDMEAFLSEIFPFNCEKNSMRLEPLNAIHILSLKVVLQILQSSNNLHNRINCFLFFVFNSALYFLYIFFKEFMKNKNYTLKVLIGHQVGVKNVLMSNETFLIVKFETKKRFLNFCAYIIDQSELKCTFQMRRICFGDM